MRNIKFRIWCTNEHPIEEIRNSMLSHEEINFSNAIENNNKGIDNEILMQFSGCFDDNEKEIFEGDILKFTDHGNCEWVDDVVFKNGAFQVEVENQDYDITAIGWVDDFAAYKVIGNIYENPELLEKKA